MIQPLSRQTTRRVAAAAAMAAALALSGCSGLGTKLQPPTAGIQQLTVQSDGTWVAVVRFQNYSYDTGMHVYAIDATLSLDGKPALDSPDAAKIAQAAFSASIGIDADAADLADGGYAWIEVLGSTPEKQKSFEEVKDEVKTSALETERRKEVTLAASKLVERLAKGESIETVAAETGGKVEKTPAVTRNTSPPGLAQNAVQLAFTLPKGGATSAPAAGGKARVILRVAEVTPAPAATAEQTERLKGEVAQQMQQDVLAEYISGLEARYGLSVNDAALKQALGGRDQSDSE